ncbi:MAG: hypothetical protein OEW33_08610 [Nitrospirota bacterium]|jgi:hypothetical protein|nr:hypothetical protein [Nitrospirota bacterium]MDH4360785.1 hypothetical protein [Nitrospirota bacterium]
MKHNEQPLPDEWEQLFPFDDRLPQKSPLVEQAKRFAEAMP